MKSAVVYYTRFGHNEVIAEAIAKELGAEQFQIEIPGKPSFPVMGFCSTFNVRMKIKPMKGDFSDFDLVVLCTPIWAWKPAPPARTFLREADLPSKLAVCFSTTGAQILRAQEKTDELLSGRGVQVVAYGDIDTHNASDDDLRAGARRFAQRLQDPPETYV